LSKEIRLLCCEEQNNERNASEQNNNAFLHNTKFSLYFQWKTKTLTIQFGYDVFRVEKRHERLFFMT